MQTIGRVAEELKANDSQPAQYIVDKLTVFEVVLKDTTPIITENGPQNGPQKLSDRCIKIIEIISTNNTITKEEIADYLGVGETTIRRDFIEIKQYYDIKWIGPSKGGKWEIKKK